jgi:hypothetical protein
MRKNRKRADTYRFNGNPSLHAGSIHSVTIPELESWVRRFEAKLKSGDHPPRDRRGDSVEATEDPSVSKTSDPGRWSSLGGSEGPLPALVH